MKWIGEIPEHWEVKRLGLFFTENKTINTCMQCTEAYKFNYGTLIRKDEDIDPNELKDTYNKYTILKPRDIVINGLNLNYDFVSQRVALSTSTGIITSAYIVLSPRTRVHELFFYYLLKSMDEMKLFHGMGSGIRLTLSFKDLKYQLIPIPPLAEQRAIVSYLDGKVGQIDTYIAKQTQQIELLKELKQAVTANAVTKGIANYNNHHTKLKQSGISWIGEIPEHWEVKLLSQMATLHYLSNKDVHHQNLLSLSYGRIINKDINGVSGLLPASYDTYQIIEDGNIVLRLTDLQNDQKSLRVGLCTQEGIITSAYLALQPRVTVLPAFLYLLLHAADIMKVFYSMGNGLRQNLNWGELRKLSCVLPPLPEQRAIVSYIEAQTANIDKLINAYQQQVERIKEYKQRLISDAVTGKMNVTDEQTQTN